MNRRRMSATATALSPSGKRDGPPWSEQVARFAPVATLKPDPSITAPAICAHQAVACMLVRAGAAGRELTADCWRMPGFILNGPVVPVWPGMVSPSGRVLPGAAAQGLMAAGLAAPADCAGTPLHRQWCCASFSCGKRRPCGPPLTAEPLRPLGQKPSGQARRLPPRTRAQPGQRGRAPGQLLHPV